MSFRSRKSYRSFRNTMFSKIQFPLTISRSKIRKGKYMRMSSKGMIPSKNQNMGRMLYETQTKGVTKP